MFDGEFFGESERRGRRYKVNVPARLLATGSSQPMNVRLLDIGGSGCRIETPEALAPETVVCIETGATPIVKAIVRWSHPAACGVEFHTPLPPGVLDKLLDW